MSQPIKFTLAEKYAPLLYLTVGENWDNTFYDYDDVSKIDIFSNGIDNEEIYMKHVSDVTWFSFAFSILIFMTSALRCYFPWRLFYKNLNVLLVWRLGSTRLLLK